MKALTTLLSVAVFCTSSSASAPLEYMCTPENAATQASFRGKAFAVTITDSCITLRSLEDKTRDWSWRITLKNSLGDREGSRQFCDKADDGWIGYPAVWKQDQWKLIAFDPARSPNSFACYVINKTRY